MSVRTNLALLPLLMPLACAPCAADSWICVGETAIADTGDGDGPTDPPVTTELDICQEISEHSGLVLQKVGNAPEVAVWTGTPSRFLNPVLSEVGIFKRWIWSINGIGPAVMNPVGANDGKLPTLVLEDSSTLADYVWIHLEPGTYGDLFTTADGGAALPAIVLNRFQLADDSEIAWGAPPTPSNGLYWEPRHGGIRGWSSPLAPELNAGPSMQTLKDASSNGVNFHPTKGLCEGAPAGLDDGDPGPGPGDPPPPIPDPGPDAIPCDILSFQMQVPLTPAGDPDFALMPYFDALVYRPEFRWQTDGWYIDPMWCPEGGCYAYSNEGQPVVIGPDVDNMPWNTDLKVLVGEEEGVVVGWLALNPLAQQDINLWGALDGAKIPAVVEYVPPLAGDGTGYSLARAEIPFGYNTLQDWYWSVKLGTQGRTTPGIPSQGGLEMGSLEAIEDTPDGADEIIRAQVIAGFCKPAP